MSDATLYTAVVPLLMEQCVFVDNESLMLPFGQPAFQTKKGNNVCKNKKGGWGFVDRAFFHCFLARRSRSKIQTKHCPRPCGPIRSFVELSADSAHGWKFCHYWVYVHLAIESVNFLFIYSYAFSVRNLVLILKRNL